MLPFKQQVNFWQTIEFPPWTGCSALEEAWPRCWRVQNDAHSAPARCPARTEASGPFRPCLGLSLSRQNVYNYVVSDRSGSMVWFLDILKVLCTVTACKDQTRKAGGEWYYSTDLEILSLLCHLTEIRPECTVLGFGCYTRFYCKSNLRHQTRWVRGTFCENTWYGAILISSLTYSCNQE